MTAKIIDGKAVAAEIRQEIAKEIAGLKDKSTKVPGLAVIVLGDDPASHIYVTNKGKQAKEIGMNSYTLTLPSETTETELLLKIDSLNKNPDVHGMIVQLPLPKHIKESAVINAIDPKKDADGFHISNVGKLATGQEGLVPCTPLGCSILLKKTLGDLSGKNAVVLGRSNIVGKPMAALLLKENCTVTIAHSKTKNLSELCRNADIIVAAVGQANMVKKEWVKPGAVIIDVGMNRIDLPEGKTKLAGDVDFENVKEVAGYITPVPGGVGPMTIACLLKNTLTAFKQNL